MTDKEYREELSKRFEQRYGWVDKCTRETAQDWLDNYCDFDTENKTTEVPEAAVELIDEAKDLILRLLDEINRNKVKASIETKCPICQEHHNIMGLTDAFDLRIKEDILTITDKALLGDTIKDVFKIKYCPFCGRKLPLND